MRIRDRQGAFKEVLKDHLAPLKLGSDGYVEQFVVSASPRIIVDPRYNGGRPSFASTMVPVFPILGALQAGDSRDSVASDFNLDLELVSYVDEHRGRFALIA